VATASDKRSAPEESNGSSREAVLLKLEGCAGTCEVGTVELGGKLCRILVDGAAAHQIGNADVRRAPLRPGEESIVRFEFEGQRYAVVTERPHGPERGSLDEVTAEIAVDITRLLSRREMEVVQLVCMGFLTKQIASRLQISEFTVRTYVKSVYAKLGVRSRAALVYRFMKAMHDGAAARSE
jgi:DNA-binding CsgD family transcriptional regulator